MTLTDRGLAEVIAGHGEAKSMLRKRRSDVQRQMGLLEAELSGLGKEEAALFIDQQVHG